MKLNEFKAIVCHYKELECKFGADGLQKVFSLLELNEQTVKNALPLRLSIKDFNKKIEHCGLLKISKLEEAYKKAGKTFVAECLKSITANNQSLTLPLYKKIIFELHDLEYAILKDRLDEEVGFLKEELVIDLLTRKQEAEKHYAEVIADLRQQPLFQPGNPEYMFNIEKVSRLNRLTRNHDIHNYYVRNTKVINENIDVSFCWGDELLNKMREQEPDAFLAKLSTTIISKQKELQQLCINVAKTIEEAGYKD